MRIKKEILNIMLEKAKEIALKNDCVNDSNFSVSASLLTKDEKIYIGHNIENFGIQSTCAERTVFSKALSEGEKDFLGILVIAYPKSKNVFIDAWPCGYCREFMEKFVDEDFEVYSINEKEEFICETIKNLKPNGKFLDKNNMQVPENMELKIIGSDEFPISKEYNENLEYIIDNLKKVSDYTNGYYQKEGSVLIGYKNGKKVMYRGATQTDNSASIIRAPKVALLKALSDGCTKFECAYNVKIENDNIEFLYPSYDVIQLYLQYTSLDFKFYTLDSSKNISESIIKNLLPHAFEL